MHSIGYSMLNGHFLDKSISNVDNASVTELDTIYTYTSMGENLREYHICQGLCSIH